MKASPLLLKANWRFGENGQRKHYLVEAWVEGRCAGRAHGWFEDGGQFVLEKVEIDHSHRSKGYGTAVIEQLRAKAREQECREFVIQGVRMANVRAIGLYESLGAVTAQTSTELCACVISPP